MLTLSRYVGQKFYLQPLVGQSIVIKVLSIFMKDGIRRMILSFEWMNILKIDPIRRHKKRHADTDLNHPFHAFLYKNGEAFYD